MKTISKKPGAGVCVVIPAFNEQRVISNVLKGVTPLVQYTVVVDDGSTDNTVQRCLRFPVLLLHHVVNLGQGAALQTGLEFACTLPAEFIVTFDADGQHSPEQILQLVDICKKGSYDAVLGSRFLEGGKAKNITALRRLMLRLATILTQRLTGLKVTDTHNGFRVFTRDFASRLKISHNGMAHASEILARIASMKIKYCEAPVTIRYTTYSRKKGQSVLNSFNILWDIWTERIR